MYGSAVENLDWPGAYREYRETDQITSSHRKGEPVKFNQSIALKAGLYGAIAGVVVALLGRIPFLGCIIAPFGWVVAVGTGVLYTYFASANATVDLQEGAVGGGIAGAIAAAAQAVISGILNLIFGTVQAASSLLGGGDAGAAASAAAITAGANLIGIIVGIVVGAIVGAILGAIGGAGYAYIKNRQ
jgi:hypothetical protein